MNTTTTPAPTTGPQFCTCHKDVVKTIGVTHYCVLCRLRKR